MLRILMFSISLLSCSPKLYQEPIATFYGKVVYEDVDPLCRLRQSKTYEALLEDILKNNMWGESSYVEIPYRREEKATTSVRCVY